MKTLFLLMLFAVSLSFSQAVRTEAVRNRVKNHTGAASTDSVSLTAKQVKYLVGIAINTSVASDTIIVKQGSGTIATIILGASPAAFPVFIPYNVRIDSAIVTVQRKKTSNVTTIWRDSY